MPTFKSSVSIEQPPEAVFDFLKDPRHVARFVDQVRAVEPLGDEQVRIRAEVGGSEVVTQGTFHVHEGHRRRIEWDLDVEDGYRGWLEVDPEGEVCSVTVELHTAGEAELDDRLDRALFALKGAAEAL